MKKNKQQPPNTIPIVAAVEITAGEGENGTPTFAVRAYNGGALRVKGYNSPVVVDLAGMEPAGSITANLDHDQTKRVGHVTETINSGKELDLVGSISASNAHAQEVISSATNGYPWQASIEAMPAGRIETIGKGKTATVNGQTVNGPAVIARQSRLYGFAFLSRGADEGTYATIAASTAESTEVIMETKLREYIEAAGFDPKNVSQDQVDYFAKQMVEAAPKPAALPDDPFAKARDEKERRQKLSEIAAQHSDFQNVEQVEKLLNIAIEAQTSPKDFELELLRASRPSGSFAVQSKSKPRISSSMIEASFCQAGGLPNIDKHFDEQTLEAADKEFPGGCGLEQLFRMAAERNTNQRFGGNFSRSMLEAAYAPEIQAQGWSYLNISGILSNTANKFLTQGFNSVEMSFGTISARRSTRDFKTVTSYALTGANKYEKVGDGGDIKHGELGELPYTNRVETYGRMLAITRQTIINDDLSALSQVPMKLGRGAALSLNDVFWGIWLGNAGNFFDAGKGNLLTGAGSVLDEAGLNAAEVAFDQLKDPDGEFAGTSAQYLLVPSSLYNQALRLMNSSLVVGQTDRPDSNVFAGRYTVVKSRYLEDSRLTGNSATAWYLVANPSDLAAIEIAYLNGRDTPVIENADADFSTLGVQMRGYHDFGVAYQEYRAAVKSAGA